MPDVHNGQAWGCDPLGWQPALRAPSPLVMPSWQLQRRAHEQNAWLPAAHTLFKTPPAVKLGNSRAREGPCRSSQPTQPAFFSLRRAHAAAARSRGRTEAPAAPGLAAAAGSRHRGRGFAAVTARSRHVTAGLSARDAAPAVPSLRIFPGSPLLFSIIFSFPFILIAAPGRHCSPARRSGGAGCGAGRGERGAMVVGGAQWLDVVVLAVLFAATAVVLFWL